VLPVTALVEGRVVRSIVGWSVGLVLVAVSAAGCAGTEAGLLEEGVHGAGGELAVADLPTDDASTEVVDAELDAPVESTTDTGDTSDTGMCIGWRTFTELPSLVIEVPGPIERSVVEVPGTDITIDSWQGGRYADAYGVVAYPVMFGDTRTPEQRIQDTADGAVAGVGGTVVSSSPGDWYGAPALDLEVALTHEGVDGVLLARVIDLPDARVLFIQTVAEAPWRDDALATQARMIASLAPVDPANVPEVVCEYDHFQPVGPLLEPIGDPTPLTDIRGVTLSTPGPAEPDDLRIDGVQFRYWTAGQTGLTVRVGAWTILPDDDRTTEERLADFAVLFTGPSGEVVSTTATDWQGAPAVDVEVSFDDGVSFVLARVIELPDGRVLLLQTDAFEAARAEATAEHAALIASLAPAA
jgi:hypothetical protein